MLRLLTLAAAALMAVVQTAPAADRNVVVVTLDGFPAYYLDDPQLEVPTIRGLRDKGASTQKGMIVSNPSVTWPNHTTLMTGVRPASHGVIYNGMPLRHGAGEPVTTTRDKTQNELVRVPMLFDIVKKAGMRTAALDWPCTAGSTSLDDQIPVMAKRIENATPELKAELQRAGLIKKYNSGDGGERDDVRVEAARWLLKERKPRLLAIHLAELDSVHHEHGPGTPEGRAAAHRVDARVGALIKAIDEAGQRDNTALFVIADHGFIAVTKTLNPNSILAGEGLIKTDGDKITKARVQVIPEGGVGLVYLTDPATRDEDRATVRRLFEGAEGVAAVLDAKDFPSLGLPTPEIQSNMADMIIAAKEGYAVGGSVKAKRFVTKLKKLGGKHGYLSAEPKMNALFVAAGAGIKPGSKASKVENVDIAPTVAHLLDVALERTDGRVLSEILTDGEK